MIWEWKSSLEASGWIVLGAALGMAINHIVREWLDDWLGK